MLKRSNNCCSKPTASTAPAVGLDLAFKRYEQVLNIDKYNIAARRGMGNASISPGRGMPLTPTMRPVAICSRQVDKSWELPVRRFEVGASTIIEQPADRHARTSLINRKLDEIIIPRVDFRDATIREALDFSNSALWLSTRPTRILRAGASTSF